MSTQQADASAPIQIAFSRFVTIDLAAAATGFSPSAIRTKIARGVWVSGREYVHAPDGRVLIDMRGYERWAATAQA